MNRAVDGVLVGPFRSDRSADKYREGVFLFCQGNSDSLDERARLERDGDKESDK